MALKLAIVVQPPKNILDEAICAANKYTRKNYKKTSEYIRYLYPTKTVFRVPHITLRGSSLVKTSEIPEFLNKIKNLSKEFKPFKVVLNGTRAFFNNRMITVYYWHVKSNFNLQLLNKKLDLLLNKRWPALTHKTYTPHLTLVVDETKRNPLQNSKPTSMPKKTCIIDKVTILYRLSNTKNTSYQKVYKTIQFKKLY